MNPDGWTTLLLDLIDHVVPFLSPRATGASEEFLGVVRQQVNLDLSVNWDLFERKVIFRGLKFRQRFSNKEALLLFYIFSCKIHVVIAAVVVI